MKYAIIDDATKVVLNIIIWDGVTPYTPPQGTSLVNVDGVPCDIGWIQQPDGTFTPSPEDA
jgi:hypothetical protein